MPDGDLQCTCIERVGSGFAGLIGVSTNAGEGGVVSSAAGGGVCCLGGTFATRVGVCFVTYKEAIIIFRVG